MIAPLAPLRRHVARALLVTALATALLGCSSGVSDDPPSGGGDGAGGADGGGDTGALGTGGDPAPGTRFALTLPAGPHALVEGEGALALRVALARTDDVVGAVTLVASEEDGDELVLALADAELGAGESETMLELSLPIGPRPRRASARTVRVVGTDGAGASVTATLELDVTPTSRPDIYLLAGQSNMVGASLAGTRMSDPGEPDAPDPRILQLNPTINDLQRFPSPAAYTDIDRIARAERRITVALDPLHDPLQDDDAKNGTTIGLGLAFAKRALADTTAAIVLVPAAWSDTGFCRRATSRFDGATGWNATTPASDAFAGTLLHDRAIARTDLAIAETGGILRGILWHQGEADSDTEACARAYAGHLAAMVASLRTGIALDARGAAARRGDERADVPFVVGTMSKGADANGALAPGGQFGEIKSLVDGVHRNVASVVPLSDVVDADDLVPPSYPCGFGDCIHFGAEALRELGERYYERLSELLDAL